MAARTPGIGLVTCLTLAVSAVGTPWLSLVEEGRQQRLRVQRVVQALARGVGDQVRLREALAATRASVNLLGHPRGLVLR